VTSTTHKTLRGPRGGLVLCTKEYKEVVDKGCPIVLGGPLPHVIAAKAIAFKEASRPAFRSYAKQIVSNAKALGQRLMERGATLTTGGTDNHLFVIDVAQSFGLTGRQAENALRQGRLTTSRNSVPFDTNGPWYTSGVRMGTPAVTSLGMKEKEMQLIGDLIFTLLQATRGAPDEKGGISRAKAIVDPDVLAQVTEQVADLLEGYPLYPELCLEKKMVAPHY
jgi:glycine hydroxymethyltransferase